MSGNASAMASSSVLPAVTSQKACDAKQTCDDMTPEKPVAQCARTVDKKVSSDPLPSGKKPDVDEHELDGPMAHATIKWLRAMPDSDLTMWRTGLIEFLREFGEELDVMTAFSGTDIAIKVMEYISISIHKELGVNFEIKHVGSSESDPQKIAFLKSQFGMPLLFKDFRQAGASNVALDDVTNMVQVVPWAHILLAGFPCQQKSPLNKNAGSAENRQCIQRGEGRTGEGFLACLDYIKAHRPRIIILENVPQVVNHGEGERIANSLTNLGYIVHHMQVEAGDYGSAVPRNRWCPRTPKLHSQG